MCVAPGCLATGSVCQAASFHVRGSARPPAAGGRRPTGCETPILSAGYVKTTPSFSPGVERVPKLRDNQEGHEIKEYTATNKQK